jgi:NADPH:quinone reductase-like Zn-dependent oxidoreductase
MRAVVICEPGGDPELRDDVDDPREPREGEVRIAVQAASVNPSDVLMAQYGGLPDVAPPWVAGMDAAGVVESVGPGVDSLRAGERVMAAVNSWRAEGGSHAELVVVDAASTVQLPTGASFAQAATLPMNGLTAKLSLETLDLSGGESLAVSGAAGVLASYAIPLAKDLGLRVLADAAPRDEALVASFGADLVVPRGDGFCDAVRAASPDGVDGLLDAAVLGRAAFGAVRDGGAVAYLRVWDGKEIEEREIRVHRVAVVYAMDRTDWLEELRDLVGTGRIRLRVAGEWPAERAAEAFAATAAGGVRGRMVITF